MKKGKGIKFILLSLVILSVVGVILLKYYVDNKENTVGNKIVLESGTAEPFSLEGVDEDLIDLENFDLERLTSHGKPVLIDFRADWCIPCRTFDPILEKVQEEMKDEVIIQSIDVDDHLGIVVQYPVRFIPTQILFGASGKPFIPDENRLGFYGFIQYSDKESGLDETALTVHEGIMTEQQLRRLIEEMKQQ